jgi:DNA-binding NarL/FixJ family response regulator
LIESELPLRESLRELLADVSRTAVAEAADALDGVRQAVCLRPEYVVVDMSMVDGNGLMLGQLIHELLPRSKVILLADDPATDCPLALEKGIAACVAKSSVRHELSLVLGRLLDSPS